jgi:uncharacterized FlgJ-related protein
MFLVVIYLAASLSSPKEQSLTKENLWKTIKETGIKHPDVVFAQALLESGEFKSQVFKSNNNLFGMKVPEHRQTVSQPGRKGYARYDSWKQCVYDYRLYQDFLFKSGELSREQYIIKLNKIYSEVPDYQKRLKRVMKENKKIILQSS